MKQEMNQTDNSAVYRKSRKRVWAKKTGGCAHCPYHSKENAARWRARRKARSL